MENEYNYLVYKRIEYLKKLYDMKKTLKENIKTDEKELFTIEISGLPKTGKSSIIKEMKRFFCDDNLKIEYVSDIDIPYPYSEIKQLGEIGFKDKYVKTIREKIKKAEEKNTDIIIIENGLIDSYFWYQSVYRNGKISKREYEKRLYELDDDLKLVNQLYLFSDKDEEIMKRDKSIKKSTILDKKQSISELILYIASKCNVCDVDCNNIDLKRLSLIPIELIMSDMNNEKKLVYKKNM